MLAYCEPSIDRHGALRANLGRPPAPNNHGTQSNRQPETQTRPTDMNFALDQKQSKLPEVPSGAARAKRAAGKGRKLVSINLL